ncbi:flagellar export chaperone FliS [Desulfovibrio inopinatus]|uniref:flagellar export chaperone FliS n=1 Tax=Desulfovibrio inopinatus TaxID=102109 RepID=UPI0004239A9E|nr:flagellar export chaperone FliS [Desulfovibrio inopinatus]
MQKAATAYLQTQVSSTSQGDLLILLYEAAIKFLKQAKEKIAERDYAAKGIRISKALDVINELQGSLNTQKGGDLAENLSRLYFYCSTKLLQANLKLDVNIIDEVITILSELHDAFVQINKGTAQSGAMPNASVPPIQPNPAAAAPQDPNESSKGALLSLFKAQAMKNKAAAKPSADSSVPETQAGESQQSEAPATKKPAGPATTISSGQPKNSTPNLSTYGKFGLDKRPSAGQTLPPTSASPSLGLSRPTPAAFPRASSPQGNTVQSQSQRAPSQAVPPKSTTSEQPIVPPKQPLSTKTSSTEDEAAESITVIPNQATSKTQRAFAAYASANKQS